MTRFQQRVLREVQQDPRRSAGAYARLVYPGTIGARGWAGRIAHVSLALDDLHRLGQVSCEVLAGGGMLWRPK